MHVCATSVTSVSVSRLPYLGLLMCMCVLSLFNCVSVCTCSHPGLLDVCALSSHSGLIDLWRRFSPQ